MTMRNTPWLLLAGLTVGFAAHAGETTPPASDTGFYNGVTVAIDPATGRLRAPTAAEVAALRAKAPRAGTSPMSIAQPGPKTRAEALRTMRTHKDGHVSMQTSDDMMSQVVATQNADGSIQIRHVGADGKPVHDHSAGEIK